MTDPNPTRNGDVKADHPLQHSAVEAIKREAVRLLSFSKLNYDLS